MDLIVAATATELGSLVSRSSQLGVRTLEIGIGVVDAAANLARDLAGVPEGRVLFVGTAGAFPDCELTIGDIVAVCESRLVDGYDETAYLPEPMVTRTTATIVPPGLPQVLAMNRIGITSGSPRRATAATVENMEVHGVLRTCELAGVSAGAILAVSNIVGPNAHEEWLAHREEVVDRMAETVARILRP